ncbi:MAG: histidinol-phosphate transaminase [bacterium]
MSVLKWMNPNVDQIRPYEPGRPIEEVAREQGLEPDTVCKLASNENPLGVSRRARFAMRNVIEKMNRYPDGNAFYLRQKLADHHDLAPNQLIFGAGSNELLEFVGHAFLGPNRAAVCAAYAFIVYRMVAQMFGSRVIEIKSCRRVHRLGAMAKAIRPDTSVVFVGNPNNPTGSLVRQAEINRFMNQVPDDVLVVFDEPYAELCLGRMPDTIRLVREGRPNVLVLRSFSKAYGLAGLRIGYGLAAAPVIAALEKTRQPFNTTSMAQAAAIAAISDHRFVARSRRLFRLARALFERVCYDLNLDYQRTYANFMLINVGDGAKVTAKLAQEGLIVRPMAGYGLPQYIRISFGTMPENERLAAALTKLFKK